MIENGLSLVVRGVSNYANRFAKNQTLTTVKNLPKQQKNLPKQQKVPQRSMKSIEISKEKHIFAPRKRPSYRNL